MRVTLAFDVTTLSQNQVKDNLSLPFVIWDLVDNGQAQEVIRHIKTQPTEAQKEILAAPGAMLGLEMNGQAQAIKEIKAGWKNAGGALSETAKQVPILRREGVTM